MPAILAFLQNSSSDVTLGALSIIRAAIADEKMALKMITLGLVPKLAAIVRQSTQGTPPPLPPRRDGAIEQQAEGARKASAAAATGTALPPERHEELCAALEVLSGLAEHNESAYRMLGGGDLGCLLQVRRSRMFPCSTSPGSL